MRRLLWLVTVAMLLLALAPVRAGPADAAAEQVRHVRLRQLRLLGGLLRLCRIVEARATAGQEVDWERLGRTLRAGHGLERELSARESALTTAAGAPPAADLVDRLLEKRRGALRRALDSLGGLAPQPPCPADWFGAEPAAVPATGPPRSAAAVRLRLRTVPAGSVDGLFGAAAAVARTQLPVRRP